jgi:hypothetical protein
MGVEKEGRGCTGGADVLEAAPFQPLDVEGVPAPRRGGEDEITLVGLVDRRAARAEERERDPGEKRGREEPDQTIVLRSLGD